MPHSDHSPSPSRETFSDLPPFPDNVPTAPLLRISLQKLLQGDPQEEDRCWKACCDLGFFYLDLRSSRNTGASHPYPVDGDALLEDANSLFEVAKSFFDLDVTEKVNYDFKDQGSYFGYKGYGQGVIDKQGTKDRNEFYNISKDDILNNTPPLPAPTILHPHRPLYKSYIQSSHTLCMLLTSLISSRLPLTPAARAAGSLASLHALSSLSGDQIRFVKAPPQTQTPSLKPGVALGAHTDFGSVTVLFNRLGGLQVQLPESIQPVPPSSLFPPPSQIEQGLCQGGWAYVRPLPGHCIINLGDAMVKFSGGKVRSNIHRVVGAPGAQGAVERYSVVYFCRPGDGVVLRGLVEGEGEGEGEEVTAKEWILRKVGGMRVGGFDGKGRGEVGMVGV
ncbi:Clavaminate synthase-like protein [Plenodomus tracheiphilus IPT5]|uniref:Clavaminate synthase-like protein n=1 Tax=Plenodomus tracheiphilus IPT5 TaxID=1408161 RepID=A0A6A7BIS7_9PLEO|nr:Clavaminate synthase-like protein [Plenodomus tracheiphilus IPT5]